MANAIKKKMTLDEHLSAPLQLSVGQVGLKGEVIALRPIFCGNAGADFTENRRKGRTSKTKTVLKIGHQMEQLVTTQKLKK